MCERASTGVVYSEFRRLTADTPLQSLWTYRSSTREPGRRPVQTIAGRCEEYWLERGDPLLNTILPGTAMSLVVNVGEPWTTCAWGAMPEALPAVSVFGPSTQARRLHVGQHVRALGAVLPATFAAATFGCRASDLVNRIVALEDLWPGWRVARLHEATAGPDDAVSLAAMLHELRGGLASTTSDAVVARAARTLNIRGGRVPIRELALVHGVSHQTFARRFGVATGLPPKQFARISRFQALVNRLLVTDVDQWAVTAPSVGFYDQAHMINEFRTFAGQPPTSFFQSHDRGLQESVLRGRPCEWSRPRASACG